jgi:hypothetical protein
MAVLIVVSGAAALGRGCDRCGQNPVRLIAALAFQRMHVAKRQRKIDRKRNERKQRSMLHVTAKPAHCKPGQRRTRRRPRNTSLSPDRVKPQKCGRRHEVVEYDDTVSPWKELSRNLVVDISAAGVRCVTLWSTDQPYCVKKSGIRSIRKGRSWLLCPLPPQVGFTRLVHYEERSRINPTSRGRGHKYQRHLSTQ